MTPEFGFEFGYITPQIDGLNSMDLTKGLKDDVSVTKDALEALGQLLNQPLKSFKSKVIEYSDSIVGEMKDILEQKKLDAYNNVEELMAGINTALKNPTDKIDTKTPSKGETISAFGMNNLMILYQERESSTFVFKTVWSSYFEETGTKPTKEWLDSLCMVLNLESLL